MLTACCVGYLEQYSSARHSLGLYHNVAVSASYSSSVPNVALQKVIYPALSEVIRQHPVLSAIVKDEDTSAPYFARLPLIDLNKCVSFVSRKRAHAVDHVKDAELDELLEEQHNTDFKGDFGQRPFWRLIILTETGDISQFFAIFVFHHAVGDGQSGAAFHRSFYSALSKIPNIEQLILEESTTLTTSVVSPHEPLVPSLESLHKLPLSVVFILKALWYSWYPPSTSGLWTALPVADDLSQTRTRYRSFAIPQDITRRLLEISRAHSTTLTATIEVLLADVLFVHLPPEISTLRCNGSISFRQFLPNEIVSENSIGTWLSTYTHDHSRSEQIEVARPFPWEEAKEVKSTIYAEVAKNGSNSVIGLLRYAGDIRSFLLDKLGKQRNTSFEISNLGLFKSPLYSPTWRIGRILFSQSFNVVGAPFSANMITGGDGCLSIGFSWLDGVVDEDLIEKVMCDLQVELEKLGTVVEGAPATD